MTTDHPIQNFIQRTLGQLRELKQTLLAPNSKRQAPSEKKMDETLNDSFPASDAPNWQSRRK